MHGTNKVDRICLAVSGALFAFFLVAQSATAQCNPGRVFDERNLSLGNALAQGTLACQDGRCNQPAPAAPAAAAASSTALAEIQKLQATIAQLQGQLNSMGGPSAVATAGGYKPLRMAQHGSSAGAAAAAAAAAGDTGYYEPAPMPPASGPLAMTPEPVQVQAIPVALANASTASDSSVSNASNSCNGGRRGIFRRAVSRTRTRTTSNGNVSSSSSTSVSR